MQAKKELKRGPVEMDPPSKSCVLYVMNISLLILRDSSEHRCCGEYFTVDKDYISMHTHNEKNTAYNTYTFMYCGNAGLQHCG